MKSLSGTAANHRSWSVRFAVAATTFAVLAVLVPVPVAEGSGSGALGEAPAESPHPRDVNEAARDAAENFGDTAGADAPVVDSAAPFSVIEQETPAPTSSDGSPGNLIRPAAPLGERTEVVEWRTEGSTTWRNPDGSFTTESSTEPVHAEVDGQMIPIDTTLEVTADGSLQAEATTTATEVAGNAADAELARVEIDGGHAISYGLDGAAPVDAEQIAPNAVRYVEVLPETDIELEVLPNGVKETIVVNSLDAVRPWTFDVDDGSLTPELVAGGIVFVDTFGARRAHIPPGFALDAAGVRTDNVTYGLSEDNSRLTVTLDPAWAADPARVWPIAVDPTVTNLSSSDDTTQKSCSPNTSFSGAADLQVGSFIFCAMRSPVQFRDFSWMQIKAKVLNARLNLYNFYTTEFCPQYPVYATELATPWDGATFVYSSPFQFFPQFQYASAPAGFGGTACPAGGNVAIDVTPSVQAWFDGTRSNTGWMLTGGTDIGGGVAQGDNFKQLGSRESFVPPTLSVTWSQYRASYGGTFLRLPSSTEAGNYRLDVTNLGSGNWGSTSNPPVYATYSIFNASGNLIADSPTRIDIPNVAAGATQSVTVPVAALSPGLYQLAFQLVVSPNSYFSGEGSPPRVVNLNIPNQSPRIDAISPAGRAAGRQPAMTVSAVDRDNWPAGGALTYEFRACRDEEMTSGCVSRAAAAASSWQPTLSWGTWYWTAAVRDAAGATTLTNPVELALIPSQPDVVDRLGQHGGVDSLGVDAITGNYTTTNVDARLEVTGPPLVMARTYNSLDTRTNGPLGPGWSTPWDFTVTPEPGTDTVLVTYPDGRAERWGHNSDNTFLGPDANATLTRLRSGSTTTGYELRSQGNVTSFNASGQLTEFRDRFGRRQTLSYTSGRLTTIVDVLSGRALTVSWSPSAPFRVTSVSAPSAGSAGTSVINYSYDGTGRLASVCGPRAATECWAYTYGTSGSDAGRMTRAVAPPNTAGPVTVARIGYASDSRVAWIENGLAQRTTYSDDRNSAAGQYTPLTGARLVDTGTSLNPGVVRTVTVTGAGGVPGDASRVSAVNLVVSMSNPRGSGFVQVVPSGRSYEISALAFGNARPISGEYTVPVSATGTIDLRYFSTDTAASQITVDVVGWYGTTTGGPASLFHSVPGQRVIDTRNGMVVGPYTSTWGAGVTRDITATGTAGVPVGATAAVVAITSVEPTATTALTAFDAGATRPQVPTMRTWNGAVVNTVTATVRLSSSGAFALHNSAGSTHIVVDVIGYYAQTAGDRTGLAFIPVDSADLNGARILDSRLGGSAVGPYTTPWGANAVRAVPVTGAPGIPRAADLSVRSVKGVLSTFNASAPSEAISVGALDSTTNRMNQAFTRGNQSSTAIHAPVGVDGAFQLGIANATADMALEVTGVFAQPQITQTTTNPLGDATTEVLDSFARTSSTTDALGNRTRHTYNSLGLLDSTTLPTGEITRYRYNASGFPVAVGQAGCATCAVRTTFTEYDTTADPASPRFGLRTATRDARTPTRTGEWFRWASGNEGSQFRTTFAYTATGQPSSTTDPLGRTTQWTYAGAGTTPAVGGGLTPEGLVLTERLPSGATTSYAYFANGDVASVTSPTGARTEFTYDSLGRRTSRNEISTSFASAVTTFTYDRRSMPLAITHPSTTDAVSGTPHQRVEEFTYDAFGNTVSRTERDAFGIDAPRTSGTWEFDAANRPVRVTDGALVTTMAYDSNGNVIAESIDGTTTRYSYNARNDRATTTLDDFVDDPIGAPTQNRDVLLESVTYDAVGRPVTRTDAKGRTTRTTYSETGHIDTTTLLGFVADPVGAPNASRDLQLFDADYNAIGLITQLSRAGGLRTTATYNAAGQVDTVVSDPGGTARRTVIGYDSSGQANRATRSGAGGTANLVKGIDYNANGTVSSTYNVVGNGRAFETTFGYDNRGVMIWSQDAAGARSDYANDVFGRPVVMTAPAVETHDMSAGIATVRPTTTLGYNTYGDASRTRDPVGRVVTTAHDVEGRPTRVTYPTYNPPGGNAITPTELAAYDARGRVVEETDPRGGVTTTTYDALDRVIRTEGPSAAGQRAVSRMRYDDAGQVIEQTAPTTARHVMTYDGLDRLVAATLIERFGGPSSNSTVNLTTRATYDDAGRLLNVTAPAGQRTNSYNAVGDLLTTSDVGGTTTYAYDSLGRTARADEPTGRSVRAFYDDRDQHVRGEIRDSAGALVSEVDYGYDALGRRTSVTDSRRVTRTATYNTLGWLLSSTQPVTGTTNITTSTGYDAAGRPTRSTDGNGNVTWQTYNTLGLVESEVEPPTTAHSALSDRRWQVAYDAGGLPIVTTKPGGVTVTAAYDGAGRVTNVTGAGAEAATETRGFSYDVAGRMVASSTPSQATSVTYNDRDLPLVVSGASPATYHYDAAGNPITRIDAAGTTQMAWNDQSQLTSVTDPLSATTATMSYGPGGRIAAVDFGGGVRRSFGYDGANRLTNDTMANGAATLFAETTAYDGNGNIVTRNLTAPTGNGAHTYAYDLADRLTSWVAPGGASTAYTYDANHNRTSAGARTFTYDARNRIASSVATGVTTSFAHSARGGRTSATVGTTTTTARFDAFDQIATDTGVAYTYDAMGRMATRNGTQLAWSGLTTDLARDGTNTFAYGLEGSALATRAGTAPATRLLPDRHGDVVGSFVPGATALASSRTFEPWGTPVATTGTPPHLGFQGDWTDPSTSRVNANARLYDPATASFTTRDSVDDPAMSNRYGYSPGNPLKYTDPTGNIAIALGPIAIGAALLVAGYTAIVVGQHLSRNPPSIPCFFNCGGGSIIDRRSHSAAISHGNVDVYGALAAVAGALGGLGAQTEAAGGGGGAGGGCRGSACGTTRARLRPPPPPPPPPCTPYCPGGQLPTSTPLNWPPTKDIPWTGNGTSAVLGAIQGQIFQGRPQPRDDKNPAPINAFADETRQESRTNECAQRTASPPTQNTPNNTTGPGTNLLDDLNEKLDKILNPNPTNTTPHGAPRSAPQTGAGDDCPQGRAAVDADALIRAIDFGDPAVDIALRGRSPVASPRAAQQFLVRGSQIALDGWLAARGGGIGSPADPGRVLALENQAQSMGRAISHTDAEVAASAIQDGLPLITRDQQLFRFLQAASYPAELF